MKLLVVEFVTAGGYLTEPVPESLYHEGRMMLQALLAGLSQVSSLEISVLLSKQNHNIKLPEGCHRVLVEKPNQFYQILQTAIKQCDCFLPIAPEQDEALVKLAELSELLGKSALLSSPAAIRLFSDKQKTLDFLESITDCVVKSCLLGDFKYQFPPPWVVKPIDGVGCEQCYLVADNSELVAFKRSHTNTFVIQPFIPGRALSLSCLFKSGKAWLLCCNRQMLEIRNGKFQLTGCEVNIAHNNKHRYQQLIDKIAVAEPGLWGYVGIDFIEQDDGKLFMLEINPRLTTSFVGISQALGVNMAEQLVQLIDQEPEYNKALNKTITVNLV